MNLLSFLTVYRQRTLRYMSVCGICLGVVLFCSDCANPIAPTGGERDTIPPRLLTDKSTPNLQTNFEKQPILLTFDEWVVLRDKRKNIITSPPLEKGELDVSIKKKTVVVEFPETENLKTAATYVIYFGEAIQDLTENNPASNLRFVFSTGDNIDSLMLKGRVVDAFSAEAVPDVSVMMYRALQDSVVYTERPFYLSKTDDTGRFEIGNISAGTYKIVAVEDDFQDYLFSKGERIAFMTDDVILSDSLSPNLTLRLFQPAVTPSNPIVSERNYGKLGLLYNTPIELDSLTITTAGASISIFSEIEQDTVQLWYEGVDSVAWEVYVQHPDLSTDTIAVRPRSRTSFLEDKKLQIQTRLDSLPKKLNPAKAIRLAFAHPITQIDTQQIQLIADSTTRIAANYRLDTTVAQRELLVEYDWQDSSRYKIVLLPGALTDMYGLSNDTIIQSYQTLSATDFGTINFELTKLDSTQQYVLRLLFGKENLVDTYLISNTTNWTQSVSMLPPGEYRLEWIEDDNRNGKWDVGDYNRQTLPESVAFKSLPQVRANWDIAVSFSPDEFQQ